MTTPTLDRSIPDALSVPGLDYKAAKPGGAGALALDDETGVVEALVSITGVVDEVGDIILPGAYKSTLDARKPKGVFSHDWGRWVARTDAVEEWLPGDPRLPTKTRDGAAWPKAAGALYVKMRFNVKSDEGRNAYENVKFFSETGECEWSIGYHVPAGQATKRDDGVRLIKALDLFEYSPVLFGAAPLSGTLAVKSRLAALADADEDVEEAFIAALHEEGLVGADWETIEAAARLLDETPTKSLLERLEAKAGTPGVADTPSDLRSVERLKRWYEHGGGAAQIRWGTEGDFMRCVRIAGKHMTPERAKGFCANRHKGATGAWPGHAPSEQHKAADGEILTKWSPAAEVGRYAGHSAAEPPSDEAKEYPYLAGSIEEGQSALRRAVTEALRGERVDGGSHDSPERREWDYVEIVATQPAPDDWRTGRVICRRNCWESSPSPYAGQSETYAMDYEIGADGTVTDLGDPEPVWIEVTAEVMTAGLDEPADDVADSGDDAMVPFAWAVPIKAIDAAASAVRIGASMRTPEVKYGRALSTANAERVKGAVQNLIAVLKAAGVDLDPAGDDAPSATPSTTGGGATDPEAVDAQTKDLDPLAFLADLRAFQAAHDVT